MVDEKDIVDALELKEKILRTMEDAIQSAVETAIKQVAEHPVLGQSMRRPSDDYFTTAAIHKLFLIHCGAIPGTNMGGSVKKASKLLHIGTVITRHWHRDEPASHHLKLPGGAGPTEEDLQDRKELIESAGRAALGHVVQALVAHVSAKDEAFNTSINQLGDRFVASLEPRDERANWFVEHYRSSVDRLIGKT